MRHISTTMQESINGLGQFEQATTSRYAIEASDVGTVKNNYLGQGYASYRITRQAVGKEISQLDNGVWCFLATPRQVWLEKNNPAMARGRYVVYGPEGQYTAMVVWE